MAIFFRWGGNRRSKPETDRFYDQNEKPPERRASTSSRRRWSTISGASASARRRRSRGQPRRTRSDKSANEMRRSTTGAPGQPEMRGDFEGIGSQASARRDDQRIRKAGPASAVKHKPKSRAQNSALPERRRQAGKARLRRDRQRRLRPRTRRDAIHRRTRRPKRGSQ